MYASVAPPTFLQVSRVFHCVRVRFEELHKGDVDSTNHVAAGYLWGEGGGEGEEAWQLSVQRWS